jgi:hypothetical protein
MRGMKEYDVSIIGSGAGANLVGDALEHNIYKHDNEIIEPA